MTDTRFDAFDHDELDALSDALGLAGAVMLLARDGASTERIMMVERLTEAVMASMVRAAGP